MQTMVDLTADLVKGILQKNRCVSLSNLEKTLDTSFNLVFLAVDHLVMKQQIILRKVSKDYVICMKGGEILQNKISEI